MIPMEVLGNMIKIASASSAWDSVKSNVGETWEDTTTGLSQDMDEMKTNFSNNWDRNKKESQYGNLANVAPVAGAAALLAPLGLYGAHRLMGRLSPFSLAARLFGRGKKPPVA